MPSYSNTAIADNKNNSPLYAKSLDKPGSQMQHHRSFGLDLARAIAIGLVLASHFSHNALDFLGFWGVELFFALSGFLIGQILWRSFSQSDNWGRISILNFWQRRWWRTIPNYYLFFIVALISSAFSQEILPSLWDLSKFIWFGQFLFNHNWGFYSISWSLCIEEWFYLLFPLTLLLVSKITDNRKVSFASSLLLLFIASVSIRLFLISQHSSYYIRGITLARLDSIGYGVLVAFLISVYEIRFNKIRIAFYLGVCFQIFSLINIYVMGLANTVGSQLFLILVPLGFSLTMPYISLLTMPDNKYLFIRNSIKKISLWSYSIYLSHGPLMWGAYFLLKDYRTTFYGNFISKVFGLVLTLVISAALYKFFELPFTNMRSRELKS